MNDFDGPDRKLGEIPPGMPEAPSRIQPDKPELRHTPTPWCLSGEPLRSRLIMREVPGMCDGGDAYCVAEAHWHSLLPIEEAKANADFIVEAVNSYASLKSQVEGLRKALEAAEKLYQVGLLNAPAGLAAEVVALRRSALSLEDRK